MVEKSKRTDKKTWTVTSRWSDMRPSLWTLTPPPFAYSSSSFSSSFSSFSFFFFILLLFIIFLLLSSFFFSFFRVFCLLVSGLFVISDVQPRRRGRQASRPDVGAVDVAAASIDRYWHRRRTRWHGTFAVSNDKLTRVSHTCSYITEVPITYTET